MNMITSSSSSPSPTLPRISNALRGVEGGRQVISAYQSEQTMNPSRQSLKSQEHHHIQRLTNTMADKAKLRTVKVIYIFYMQLKS